MKKQFAGKTALVTGGGTGIGRAVAIGLATEGCVVTVAGRTQKTLHETAEIIKANGGSAQLVICDVTRRKTSPQQCAPPQIRTQVNWILL